MKKVILVALIVGLMATGCSTITIDKVDQDGSQCRAQRTAFFMSSGSIQGEACGGAIGATDSKAEAAALGAIVSAAIAASIKSVGGP